MTGPVVPSGADFDEDRDLGGAPRTRLGKLFGRVKRGGRGPVVTPARVEPGVGESMTVARLRTPPPDIDQFLHAEGHTQSEQATAELVPDTATSGEDMARIAPKKARKRVVMGDGSIPLQPAPLPDEEYHGTWDHSRGEQKNVRDQLDPKRDISYYDD